MTEQQRSETATNDVLDQLAELDHKEQARAIRPFLKRIEDGTIDPAFVADRRAQADTKYEDLNATVKESARVRAATKYKIVRDSIPPLVIPPPQPLVTSGDFSEFGVVGNDMRAVKTVGANVATHSPSDYFMNPNAPIEHEYYLLFDNDPPPPIPQYFTPEQYHKFLSNPKCRGGIIGREPDLPGKGHLEADAYAAFIIKTLDLLKAAKDWLPLERQPKIILRIGSQFRAPWKPEPYFYPHVHRLVEHRYGELYGVAMNSYASQVTRDLDRIMAGEADWSEARPFREWTDRVFGKGFPIVMGELGISTAIEDSPLLVFYLWVCAQMWRDVAKIIFYYIAVERGDGYYGLVRNGGLTHLGEGFRALQLALA